MKKLLLVLLLLPMAAFGELHVAEYGKAATFDFVLYNTDGTLDVDEVDGGSEVALSCNEGSETTATNDFADEGTFYSIALTAAEMSCARVAVVIAATDTNVFFVETYGHPSAQNPCGMESCLASGTAQASTASTIVLASATSITDDYLNGAKITIVEGTGAGQTRICSDWAQSTDTCTVNEDWDTTPSTDSDYLVFREKFATIEVDASGYVSANVRDIDPNQIGASELADDAGTELATAVGALTVEDQGDTYNLKCALATILAYAAGTVTTTSGTSVYQDPGANENRITGTVTSTGRGTITIVCP